MKHPLWPSYSVLLVFVGVLSERKQVKYATKFIAAGCLYDAAWVIYNVTMGAVCCAQFVIWFSVTKA